MVYRVFVAFAGGGAKALIHVGALRALEQRGVKFVGVAGTSAGALVATLKAAGFTADDMLDQASRRTIVDKLREIDPQIRKISDVFGSGGWSRIRLLRSAIEDYKPAIVLVALVFLVVPFLLGWLGARIHWLLALPFIALAVALAILLVRFVMGGLADLKRFRDALNVLLQRKMFPTEPNRLVRMRDFDGVVRPSLKIVSANLSRGRLHLFSSDRTPDMPVADAVAASVCLPVIFVPHVLDGDLHMDGGIVSNLPAWPFDEERELDPEATTIAVEIATQSERRPLTRHSWIQAFVRTALFGSGELSLRISGAAERLNLESSLSLLDFDLSLETACQEVKNAEDAASVRLDKRLFRRPELYRDACSVVQVLVDDVMTSLGLSAPHPSRVAIATRDRNYRRSLRFRYSIGYETSPDEAMLVPIDGSVAGAAWVEKESRFEIAPLVADLAMPGPANRRRRNQVSPALKWMLCVPIFDRVTNEPRLMVQIDGDEALPVTSAVEEAVTEIEKQVTEFFSLIISELSELEDDDGLEE